MSPKRRPSPRNGAAPPRSGLMQEGLKAAVAAIVVAVLGYAGGLIVPPSRVYDRLFRQDPNDLSGRWTGEVGGRRADLVLVEHHPRQLTGDLTLHSGHGRRRSLHVEGNHDGNVYLQADWDAETILSVSMTREVGVRHSEDDEFVKLVQPNLAVAAARICPGDGMNVETCPPFGTGGAFLSRSVRDGPL